ncbi:2Fe-2S iron-sulfur cluster-binding protein [uncultured Mycobacterium sp.]|uniref:2Fe-2S iron-sulfur cluster-binding protein n=1 Tax=uncultured Mycobacterium sp. TaxID=171292 RepID=UPI0035CB645A
MAELHVFQQATVTRVIKETADTRSFVLAPHQQPFPYRAGQYCTFRVHVDGEELYRSDSMSSAPETDPELMTTVKRVPGGKVSNCLVDSVAEGDELTMTRAAGTFCLQPTSVPLLAFAGGSGVTPIGSLIKSAFATTDRSIRVLCADRDRESVIFEAVLDELVVRYPGRLTVMRHIDVEQGLIDADALREFVGSDVDADNYVCGPGGFMAVVRSALSGPGRVFVEDFDLAPTIKPQPSEPAPDAGTEAQGTVTIFLERKKASVPRVPGETLLETARRAGLTPPFSCEQGNCGTCMALLTEGRATIRNNEALDNDEVDEGYILTCQSVPDTPSVTVRYE